MSAARWAILVLVLVGSTVAGLALVFGSGAVGSLVGSKCEWTPLTNGSYSSVEGFESDYRGDFSELREKVDFRTRDGVLEYRLENTESCGTRTISEG